MMDQHLITVVWGSGGSVTLYLKKLFSKFVCFPNLGRGQVTLTSHQSPHCGCRLGHGCHPCLCIHLVRRELCVYVHTQSCQTLCNPVDCSPPGSSVHGNLQARILE